MAYLLYLGLPGFYNYGMTGLSISDVNGGIQDEHAGDQADSI